MKKKGFTLLEVVLVVLLIGIIAGFIGGFLYQEINFYNLLIPRREVKIENKLIFERILKEIKDAYKNSYNSGNNIRFKIPYTTFKGYTSVRIYLSSNKIYLSTNGNPATVIGDKVTYFNLTSIRWYPERDLVRVRLVSNVNNNTLEQQTEIFLRNTR